MKEYDVAVVGATGLVGQKMLAVLEERRLPVRRLIAVASEKSRGTRITFRDQHIDVQPLSQEVFTGVDIALFSAGSTVSREFAPAAVAAGAVAVDNSSAWRMDPAVPLVVPEVNPGALRGHTGIIANPNCSTIQMVVALHPLHQHFQIRRVVVSTYQSVSGYGKAAVDQLAEEISTGSTKIRAFPHRIAYNCLPHIDAFREDGYTKEEYKMIDETRKIMGDDSIQVSPTTVRVPVYGGHSESINIEFVRPFQVEAVREILRHAPGIVVQDNPAENLYPMPVNAAERDEVFVGRIRRDPSIDNGLNMWVVSDNLRKGAATNAVQIVEKILEMNLLHRSKR